MSRRETDPRSGTDDAPRSSDDRLDAQRAPSSSRNPLDGIPIRLDPEVTSLPPGTADDPWAALVHLTPQPVCLTDIDTARYLDANDRYLALTGYARGELIGRTVAELGIWGTPEQRARVVAAMVAAGHLRDYKVDITTGTGEVRPVLVSTAAIARPGRRALLSLLTDLTEQRRAEAERQATEARFRALFQHTSDLIIVIDADATVIFESPSVTRVLGYDPEERIGMVGLDFVHPDDLVTMHGVLGEVLAAPGVTVTTEIRARHKDGSWRWLEGAATNLLAESNVGGIVVNCRDITERRAAEAAAHAGAESFDSLFHATAEGLAIHDGRVLVAVNRTLAVMVGYDVDTIVGKSPLDFIAPASVPEVRDHIADNADVPYEALARRKDGSTFPAELLGRPVRYQGNDMRLVSIRDISERKAAKAALTANEARFRSLIQNASEFITILDATGMTTYTSPAIQRMLGYQPDELVGRSAFELIHPDDLAAPMGGMATVLADPTLTPTVEFRYRHKNGEWRWFEAIGTNLSADPAVGGIVVNARDVTERKRTVEELRAAKAAAEEASRLKSHFLSTMSHELRTPMNSIIGYAHLLLDGLDGELTEQQAADVAQIAASADRLLALINDVLDLAKIEAGRVELQPEQVDLKQLISETCRQVAPQAAAKTLALMVDAPNRLVVDADPLRLRQILLNLVANAVKFTEVGRVTVTARAEAGFVEIAVADTGIGIPPEALPHIFDEFRQADGSTSRRHGGTGLGLAIARNLAEIHGGGLTVASRTGVGSTFTLRLPVPDAEWVAAAGNAPVAKVEVPAPAASDALPRPTVLLVEDDLDFAEVVRRTVEAEGFRLVHTTDGAEALWLAADLRPVLVLLDILLPGDFDGWQVLHGLRANAAVHAVPVVVASALDDRRVGAILGATDYLVKPIDRRALLSALDRANTRPPAEVLVVDDDPAARELLGRRLTEAGYRVRDAANGDAALATMRQRVPDLVLLDLLMAGTDGFQVLDAVRDDAAFRGLPVVVVSAKELTAAEGAWLRERTSAVLAKAGLQREEFLAQIRTALSAANGVLGRREPSSV